MQDSERKTAYYQLKWLHWLLDADPDCELAQSAIDDLQTRYPDYRTSDHPDLTHWTETAEIVRGPWTVNELLETPVSECLDELLTYQPSDLDMYSRRELLSVVEEAIRQDLSWGLELADSLAESEKWDSDIWPSVMRGWSNVGVEHDNLAKALGYVTSEHLQRTHLRECAKALLKLAQAEDASRYPDFLSIANSAAIEMWHQVDDQDSLESLDDWLLRATNHPAGHLAQFWIVSIILWRRQQEFTPSELNSQYRMALTQIMQREGLAGRLGRCVLASHLHLMLEVDETWAVDHLLTLFDYGNEDFLPAWDGFLTQGRLTPAIVETFQYKLLSVMERVEAELAGRRQERFVLLYTRMLAMTAQGPNDRWIIKLFRHGGPEVRWRFAMNVGELLRGMTESQQIEHWERWIEGYWQNRLQGVPESLSEEEILYMLGWPIHLTGVFGQAVNLATAMRYVPFPSQAYFPDIREGELYEKYPGDFARLLIHLGESDELPLIFHFSGSIIGSLVESHRGTETERELNELIAKFNLSTGQPS